MNKNKTFRYASVKANLNDTCKLQSVHVPAYSNVLSVSPSWCALPHGASKSSVLLVSTASAHTQINIAAHSSDISDLQFNHYNFQQLASGAADGTVKLWDVSSAPQCVNPPLSKYEGFDSVNSLCFHPSASGVLSVAHKTGITMLDLNAQQTLRVLSVPAEAGFGKDVCTSSFNAEGSLIACVNKANAFCVFDPRSCEAAVLGGAATSATLKKLHNALFLPVAAGSSSDDLCLFGVTGGQRPCMQWFDVRNTSVAIKQHEFDYSQGTALPIYERDTHTLYYTIRGSNILSLWDLDADKPPTPSIYPITQYSLASPCKGYGLLPKVGVNTSSCEVNRVYALGSEELNTYSVSVVRKIAGFHHELYPDTRGEQPAITSEEYWQGQNKLPLKISMAALHEARANATTQSNPSTSSVAAPTPPTSSASSSISSASSSARAPSTSVSSSSSSGAPARTSVASYVPTSTRSSIDEKLKKSVFTHNQGKEPPTQFASYFDLKLGNSVPLARNIVANSKFFAVPWRTLGGSAFAVFPLSQLGRAPAAPSCVRGHKVQATVFDLSPWDEGLFASAVEGHIGLWSIPTDGLKADLTEADMHTRLTLEGKPTYLQFHPYVKDILISAISGFDGNLIHFWNLENKGPQEKASLIVTGLPEAVVDLDVHPHSHLLAVSSKDGHVRVVNVFTSSILCDIVPPEHVRDTRVLWVSPTHILTVGFGAASTRTMSLFKVMRDAQQAEDDIKPLQTYELERVNYTLIPAFDYDTKLLYLANSGGTFIPLFEIRETAPYIEQLNIFQTNTDTSGFVLLPKKLLDVHKVETCKALKLTKDSVLPITYSVPRKRLEFFQDDLYPDTFSGVSVMSAADLCSGVNSSGVAPTLTSLNRDGRTPLSLAPVEELTIRQQQYNAQLAKANAPKTIGATGHTSSEQVKQHFIGMIGLASNNRWDARQDNSKVDVDEDEWDD